MTFLQLLQNNLKGLDTAEELAKLSIEEKEEAETWFERNFRLDWPAKLGSHPINFNDVFIE